MIRFEWDPVKAQSNLRKHGVRFEDAMHVFDDPFALFEQDRAGEAGELRWQAVGLAGGVAVLLVAHTVREEGRDELIRLVSARRATRKERERYEQNRAQNPG
ncbi:MAG TPA: BrnT family toxin [Terriglobia bacterium]|nr:BrnT family toxin [Terriglobia bacterium]